MYPKPKMVSVRGVGPKCRGVTRGDKIARRLEHVARVSGLVRRHSEVNVLKSAHREYQICPTCIINEPQAELPNIYIITKLISILIVTIII